MVIAKADGGERSLGIPTIRDQVAQTATKLVLEPIYDADFELCPTKERPPFSRQGRGTGQAEVLRLRWRCAGPIME